MLSGFGNTIFSKKIYPEKELFSNFNIYLAGDLYIFTGNIQLIKIKVKIIGFINIHKSEYLFT